jgi:hypothetical protein
LAESQINAKGKTMTHTEKEATEMQCCGPSDCGAAYESNLDGVYSRFCTASRCMAWRWNYRIVFPENEAEEEKKQNWFWGLFEPTYPTYALPPKLEKSDKGFCGLAGKP